MYSEGGKITLMIAEHVLPHEITLAEVQPMPLPGAALMCLPDYFDVVDEKNPFMRGQQGKVDRQLAKQQWAELRGAFEKIGVAISTLPPLAGCEDMVFCANPVFAGLNGEGEHLCVLGRMRHKSRAAEVAAHGSWYAANGYRVQPIAGGGVFEGSGDAIWHPGRRLIWGGYGRRTEAGIYEKLGEVFGAPVIPLELTTELFYHLDTCFCPVNAETVLVYPRALTGEGMRIISRLFQDVIEVNEYEAASVMACNGTAFFGKYFVVQRGAKEVNGRLRGRGFEVIEVDTSEFLKSGGSVFCMKMYLF